jgi:hypothetical protein
MIRGMRRTHRLLALVLAALAVTGGVAVAVLAGRSGGAPTAEAAVARYLDGLAARDLAAARAAVAPGVPAADVEARLRTYGGTPAADVTVHVLEPVRPGAARVVRLSFGGRADEVHAREVDGGWYVAFPPPVAPCDPVREVCAT